MRQTQGNGAGARTDVENPFAGGGAADERRQKNGVDGGAVTVVGLKNLHPFVKQIVFAVIRHCFVSPTVTFPLPVRTPGAATE